MKLKALIKNIKVQKLSGDLQIDIKGISEDSRTIEAGFLFVCVKGSKYDGHQYLRQAAEKGAVAALVEDFPAEDYGLTIIQTKVTPQNIKEIAGAFYEYPDQKLKLIGVVGTNGKTTSTYLVKSILEAAGYQVGLIGTIINLIKDQVIDTHNTTPGVLELQKIFVKMVEAGVEYVVMEVSSHSIAQERITGLTFHYGIFTNITQDHLDYHKTFAEYLRVKTKFFSDLPATSRVAINYDDQQAGYIIERTSANVMPYGIENQASIKAEKIKMAPTGVSYTALTPMGQIRLNLKLTGLFNVYNSLGALTVGLAIGINLETIKRGLELVTGVPGRFQLVPGPTDFGVIVDYAHTPDGLENILKTGRGLSPRRLLLVFGCGGDRDRTKRPIMGALAAKIADFTIITSDNPRSEDPGEIIKEIESGFTKANSEAGYLIETDRANAIKKAINMAETGDLVLIAGKGHETYQDFGNHRIHFDDREVASEALREKYNGKADT